MKELKKLVIENLNNNLKLKLMKIKPNLLK